MNARNNAIQMNPYLLRVSNFIFQKNSRTLYDFRCLFERESNIHLQKNKGSFLKEMPTHTINKLRNSFEETKCLLFLLDSLCYTHKI